MKNISFIVIISIITVFACRPVKKIQTAIEKKDTVAQKPVVPAPVVDSNQLKKDFYRRVYSNKIDFQHFNGKIKVDYNNSDGTSIDGTAFIRIRKDSIIWISITGPLNIEGMRLLVKPDSVIIMNKLKKTISYKSVAYLKDLVKLPVDFYTVQDLLMGNPVFFTDTIVSIKSSGSSLLGLSTGRFFKHLITIDTTDNRILHSKLDDVEETMNRTSDIILSDYNNQQGRLFSNKREITVTEKQKIEIKLDFKQANFDEPQTFPFSIPKNFKVK